MRSRRLTSLKRYSCRVGVCCLALLVTNSTYGLAQTTKGLHPGTVTYRQATLPELYEMFFAFAAHIDSTANADEKMGMDRRVYRAHLQKVSGLTQAEYEVVLASAKRYKATAEDANVQLSNLLLQRRRANNTSSKAMDASKRTVAPQIRQLIERKQHGRDNEIAGVRLTLGTERTSAFEGYLKSTYSQGEARSSNELTTTQGGSATLNASPNNVTIGPSGDQCVDGETPDGYWYTLCTDVHMSYIGPTNGPTPNKVEMYVDNRGVDWDDDLDVTGVAIEADLVGTNVGSGHECDADGIDSSCTLQILLDSGNGATYIWEPTATLEWNDDDDDPDSIDYDGFEAAEVTIKYPDINAGSYTVTLGTPGILTIDGTDLTSPFQNLPVVSVTNQSSVFSNFSLTNPNGPYDPISISYQFQANANAGTLNLTVNNGFGTDSVDLIVRPPPPTIQSVSVPGGMLIAGQTQTVTITGQYFGSTAPTISIYSAPSGVQIASGVTYSAGTSGVDTATFSVATALNTLATSPVLFQVLVNDGSQILSTTSSQAQGLQVKPFIPTPQIMRVFTIQDMTACTNGVPAPNGANQTNVVAGEQVLLCVAPPPAEFGVPRYSWNFDHVADITGGFVNGAGTPGTQPSASGGGSEAQNPSLTSGSLRFYFVNPNTTETATFTWTLNGGTSPPVTADFGIGGPTGNLMMTATMPTDGSGVQVIVGRNGPALSTTGVPFAQSQVGIKFDANANPPAGYNQSFTWVQLINNAQYQQISSVGLYASTPASGIDVVYPIMNASNTSTNDQPAVNLPDLYGESWETFTATTYLMWDPGIPWAGQPSCTVAQTVQTTVNNYPVFKPIASTCSSTPIPLSSVTWHWSGCAINTLVEQSNGTKWTRSVTGNCPVQTITVPEPSGYPQWTGPANLD